MKKGDLTTPVLLWFTTIVIAIVIIVWFVQSSAINRFDIRAVDEDLKNLRYELSLACSYTGYQSRLAFNSNYGTLSVNESSACIVQQAAQANLTRCLPTPCDVVPTTIDISAGSVEVIKDGSITIQ